VRSVRNPRTTDGTNQRRRAPIISVLVGYLPGLPTLRFRRTLNREDYSDEDNCADDCSDDCLGQAASSDAENFEKPAADDRTNNSDDDVSD
jgi:hypothetical protein